MELNDILSIALRSGASDIHIKAGLPPMVRVDGALHPMKDAQRIPPEEVSRISFSIMNNSQKERFREANEVDLAYGVPGLGRFRVNVFQQRGVIGAVYRIIPLKIQTIEELSLPPVIQSIAMEPRGLILVTGATGSGKSTTLAAMIDHINSNRTAHILTVEDPIEFLVRDKRSVVNQREIGVDTMTFPAALRAALRQDPDVILVGEMRDLETMEIAITAAETGHLVMSTLHTVDATETISRIVSSFPPHQQKPIRLQLGAVLKAVISQRLVPKADKRGRTPALEIMRNTARVREMIESEDRTKEIIDAISRGHTPHGMQTFDQSLMRLYQSGAITYEVALSQATNADDFALRASGIAGTSDSSWNDFESGQPAPKPRAASAPARGQARPAARPPGDPKNPSARRTPQAGRQATSQKQHPSAQDVDDDFTIERF